MSKKTGSAATTVTMEDGGRWEEVPDTQGGRWYRPEADDASQCVTGRLVERSDGATKYGPKAYYTMVTTEPGFDSKGDWASGDTLIVWESAGLRMLSPLVGSVVRIVPTGHTGRRRTFRVSRAV